MEADVPVWHFSMACRWPDRGNAQNRMIPVSQWGSEEEGYFKHHLKECFPPADGSRRVYIDRQTYSMHARMEMTEEEQHFVVGHKYGARTFEDVEPEIIEELKHEAEVKWR